MNLLLPIFCFTCIRLGETYHQGKYIDLLSEADKQAFLDLVARRLHNEVSTKTPKHSFSHEVSNEQLDEHSDFVKTVLAEEENNLKQQADSEKPEENYDEGLRVRGINEQKSADSGYVDLTLRNNERERRFGVNNNGPSNKSNEIPVQIVYDNDTVFSKTTILPYEEKRNTKEETTLKAFVNTSDEKDIQIRVIRRDATHNKNDTDTFTKIIDFEEEVSNDEDDKEESEEVDSSSASVDNITKKIIDTNHNSVTASINESEGKEDSNNTYESDADDNNNDKESSTTTEIVTKQIETSTIKFTIKPTTINTLSTATPSKMFTGNTLKSYVMKQKRFIRNGVKETNKSEDTKKTTSSLKSGETDLTTIKNDFKKGNFKKRTDIEILTNNTLSSDTGIVHNLETNTTGSIDASISTIYYDPTKTASVGETDTTQNIDFSTSVIENSPEVSTTVKVMNEFELKIKGNTKGTASIESSMTPNTINYETEKTYHTGTDTTEGIESTSAIYYETSETTNDGEISSTVNIDKLTNNIENVPEVQTKIENNHKFAEHNVDTSEQTSRERSKVDEFTTNESGALNVATTSDTVTPVVTVHPSSEDTAKTVVNLFKEVLNSNKNAENNYTTPAVSVFNNLLKALRQGMEFKFENNEVKDSVVPKKDHFEQKIPVEKPKEYIVYEIPANKSAFVKQNKYIEETILRTREEPYYVPIYNYSPEKAYFNAYNRLGPNYESKEEVDKREEFYKHDTKQMSFNTEDDSKALRKFKFSEKTKRIPKIMASNKNHYFKLPSVAKKKKVLNLNDYLDMDYYFGRTGKSKDKQYENKDDVSEDSEKYNPYNNIEFDTPNEYIREARLLLIKDQAYGFLDNPYRPPPIQKSDVQSEDSQSENSSDYVILYPDSNTQILLRSLNKQPKDISIDYYFSAHNNNDKEILRLTNSDKINNHNSKSKKLNTRMKQKRKRIDDQENNEHQGKPSETKIGTVKEILEMSEPNEVFNNLEKLLQLNIPLGRRNHEELKPFMKVIKDMIESENKALASYDWLGSTVDILAAVEKMIHLIEISQYGRKLNSKDSELLNYIEYLHQSSKADVEGRLHQDKEQRKEKNENIVRRKKTKETSNFRYTKGLIDKVWLYLRGRLVKNNEETEMKLGELQNFFEDLRDALYDFHNAIKSVAVVTKYKEQRWFKNIKELYLKDLQKKQCLEVLLHISAARFLGLVEESAGQNLEDSYLRYIEGHKKEVGRSKDELVFLMQVLGELKSL